MKIIKSASCYSNRATRTHSSLNGAWFQIHLSRFINPSLALVPFWLEGIETWLGVSRQTEGFPTDSRPFWKMLTEGGGHRACTAYSIDIAALEINCRCARLIQTWFDQRRAALLERHCLCFRRMNRSNALPMGGDGINFHSADSKTVWILPMRSVW